jgi:hypothetical protein
MWRTSDKSAKSSWTKAPAVIDSLRWTGRALWKERPPTGAKTFLSLAASRCVANGKVLRDGAFDERYELVPFDLYTVDDVNSEPILTWRLGARGPSLSASTLAKSNGRKLQRNTKRLAKSAAAKRQGFSFDRLDSNLINGNWHIVQSSIFRENDALQRFRVHPVTQD